MPPEHRLVQELIVARMHDDSREAQSLNLRLNTVASLLSVQPVLREGLLGVEHVAVRQDSSRASRCREEEIAMGCSEFGVVNRFQVPHHTPLRK